MLEAAPAKLLTQRLTDHVSSGGRLAIVKAPPGSGKTYELLELASFAVSLGMRIALAAQTNAQADDICRRLAIAHPEVPTTRFASGNAQPAALGGSVLWITASKELPLNAGVVVATVAKWGLVTISIPFDLLLVDEAWQMAWSDFMLLGQVSDRFVLIGDPGQIPPVVAVQVERWETSPRAPHLPAPALILEDGSIDSLQGNIDTCRRLPYDAVDLIKPFYDFEFLALAEPGERRVIPGPRGGADELDPALDLLQETSVAAITVPTDPEGPPLEVDPEIAAVAAGVVTRLLDRGADVADGVDERPLEPGHIGISAPHRVMNSAIADALGDLRNEVRVETPERWQGLERKVMVVVHPLSGVAMPSSFDLTTGRLCVMASRHRAGLVVVSRDHLPRTLDNYVPVADQAVGRPDVVGRGHYDHVNFWERLIANGHILPLSA